MRKKKDTEVSLGIYLTLFFFFFQNKKTNNESRGRTLIRLSWFERVLSWPWPIAMGTTQLGPMLLEMSRRSLLCLVSPSCSSGHWTGLTGSADRQPGQVHAGAWRHTDDYTAGDVHFLFLVGQSSPSAWNMCCQRVLLQEKERDYQPVKDGKCCHRL